MEGKKSFVLYTDSLKLIDQYKLTFEERGKLLTMILKYTNDEFGNDEDKIDEYAASIDIGIKTFGVFIKIRSDLQRDLEKYKEISRKRAESGSVGGKATQSKLKQNESNQANASNSSKSEQINQDQPNQADNDNGNVNDNGNDNDNENKENIPLSKDNSIVQPEAELLPYAEAEYDIFNFWNEAGIWIHKSLTDKIHKAISKALKLYGSSKIKEGILNYARVYLDKNYFFSYKWSLEEFLKQDNAMPTFFNDGQKWLSYTNSHEGIKAAERDAMNNIDLSDWGIN